jgi:glyoxylase-like metal-dependent hydrolase (beta-lactamase superfamily II)
MTEIRRLDLGYFVRPAAETAGDQPRVEPVLGYLVRRDEGVILFDTGMGEGSSEVDAHYRPRRRDVRAALADAGLSPADVGLVVNCHLHFDHCGGNPHFPGTPILVQPKELQLARGERHTLPWLVDFAGVSYREVVGEAEIWPGVWIIPTPGHTAGHQSMVVSLGDGTVVLAGQAHDFAGEFGAARLAMRARLDGVGEPLASYPKWMETLLALDPRRVLFAHDNSVWEP